MLGRLILLFFLFVAFPSAFADNEFRAGFDGMPGNPPDWMHREYHPSPPRFFDFYADGTVVIWILDLSRGEATSCLAWRGAPPARMQCDITLISQQIQKPGDSSAR